MSWPRLEIGNAGKDLLGYEVLEKKSSLDEMIVSGWSSAKEGTNHRSRRLGDKNR